MLRTVRLINKSSKWKTKCVWKNGDFAWFGCCWLVDFGCISGSFMKLDKKLFVFWRFSAWRACFLWCSETYPGSDSQTFSLQRAACQRPCYYMTRAWTWDDFGIPQAKWSSWKIRKPEMPPWSVMPNGMSYPATAGSILRTFSNVIGPDWNWSLERVYTLERNKNTSQYNPFVWM